MKVKTEQQICLFFAHLWVLEPKRTVKNVQRSLLTMWQSVIFGSLTLIWKFNLDFGDESNFIKIRIDHVMLKFLATTENQKLI